MRFACIVFSVSLLMSCQKTVPSTQASILNIDSLLDAQQQRLKNPKADKKIEVNDSIYGLDSAGLNLSKEFEIFRELEQLNLPIYKGGYIVTTHPDVKSNLTVREYRAKTELPILTLRLLYLDQPNKLKRVEAEFVRKDFYSESYKKLQLDFSLLGDTIRLESYHISGVQQYFWGTPNHFSITSIIK